MRAAATAWCPTAAPRSSTSAADALDAGDYVVFIGVYAPTGSVTLRMDRIVEMECP